MPSLSISSFAIHVIHFLYINNVESFELSILDNPDCLRNILIFRCQLLANQRADLFNPPPSLSHSLATSLCRPFSFSIVTSFSFCHSLAHTHTHSLSITYSDVIFSLWPDHASSYNNLGTLIVDLKEAEEFYRRAIHLQPTHVRAHFNLANNLL